MPWRSAAHAAPRGHWGHTNRRTRSARWLGAGSTLSEERPAGQQQNRQTRRQSKRALRGKTARKPTELFQSALWRGKRAGGRAYRCRCSTMAACSATFCCSCSRRSRCCSALACSTAHRTPHRSGQDEHGHEHQHQHGHEHEHQRQHEHGHEHEHEHEHEQTQLACLRTCSRAEFRALSLAFFCRCFAIAASCSAARGDCTTLSRADGGAAHAPAHTNTPPAGLATRHKTDAHVCDTTRKDRGRS